jgi:hypothetical protein
MFSGFISEVVKLPTDQSTDVFRKGQITSNKEENSDKTPRSSPYIFQLAPKCKNKVIALMKDPGQQSNRLPREDHNQNYNGDH